MKFRIKITTYNSGKQVFNPQLYVKRSWFGGLYKFDEWVEINHGGISTSGDYSETLSVCETRERALKSIDLYIYNNKVKPYEVKSIEFEYFDRTEDDVDMDAFNEKNNNE